MNRTATLAKLVSASILIGVACDSGTGGELIELSLNASSVPNGGAGLGVFTTDQGWSVVLTEARLALSAVYVFAPDPDVPGPVAALFGPSVARAHGGIDPLSGRGVRAERLDSFELDLLATGVLDLGLVDGEAGAVDAIEVRLGDPATTGASSTHGHHAYFAGVATKGQDVIAFEGGIDIVDDGTNRRIEGIALESTLTDGGALALRVHADAFFRGAHFEDLPPADAGSGVSVLAIGSQPFEAVSLGIRNPAGYSAEFADGATP